MRFRRVVAGAGLGAALVAGTWLVRGPAGFSLTREVRDLPFPDVLQVAASRRGAAHASRDRRAGVRRLDLYGYPTGGLTAREAAFSQKTGGDLVVIGGCTVPRRVAAYATAYDNVMTAGGGTAAGSGTPTPPSPGPSPSPRRAAFTLRVAAFAAPQPVPLPWDRHAVTNTTVFSISVDGAPPQEVDTHRGAVFPGLDRRKRHLLVVRNGETIVDSFHFDAPPQGEDVLCLVRTGYGFWSFADPSRCGRDDGARTPSPRRPSPTTVPGRR